MSTNLSTQPPLLVECRDQVCWLTFNRPEVHNAQDPDLLRMLDSALDNLARDRSVRAVVLGGAGASFTSGHDLRQVSENPVYKENASTVEGRYWQEQELFVEPVRKFRELPMPTVCRVQGYCLAAGLMFAGAADFVVADTTAVFGSPIVTQIAVNDAEVASFALRTGETWAKRVWWLGERLTAEEAREAGLVTWVVEPGNLDSRVTEVTTKLVQAPPHTVALSKQSLLFMANARGEREVNQFHYMAHQLSHWTKESQDVLAARVSRISQGGSPIPSGSR